MTILLNSFTYVLFLAFFIFSFIIPDNIISSNSSYRELCDYVASIVPLIDKITVLDIKPDVNRFYFSVLWAISPLIVVGWLTVLWRGKKLDYAFWVTPPSFRLFLFTGCLFFFFAYLPWNQDLNLDSRDIKSAFTLDLWRGIKGQILYFWGILIAGTVSIAYGTAILTGSIHRHIKRRFKYGTN